MSDEIKKHARNLFSEAVYPASKNRNLLDQTAVFDFIGNTVSIKADENSNNVKLTVEQSKANDVISSYNYSKVVINTVSNAPMIPSMSPILTTNGFLLQKGLDVFIVTTAHAFFSTPQTSNVENNKHTGKIQTSITVDIDGEMYHFSPDDVIYSRSLDVAFIRVSGLKVDEHTKLFKTSDFVKSNDVHLGEPCFVKYTDILSRTDSMVEGKYVPFVQGQVDMFAITNASSSGSSGSPVFNSNHKLVGMVCANPGDTNDYANMTLCVPIDTIKLLIEQGKALDSRVINKNLDDKDIFAGVFTQSVEPQVGMYIESSDGELRKFLKNGGGQRVVYSDNDRDRKGNKLQCWDIITKVGGKKIGGNESSLNKVLLENMGKGGNLTIQGYRISDYYAKRFLNLPTSYWTSDNETEGLSEIVFELTPRSTGDELYFDLSLLSNGSNTLGDSGGDIFFGANDNDTDSLFYIGQQLQYSLKSNGKDFWKFNRSYATIVDINTTNRTITIDVQLDSSKTYFFAVVPLSAAATILYFNPSLYIKGLNTLTQIALRNLGQIAYKIDDFNFPVDDNKGISLTKQMKHFKMEKANLKLNFVNTPLGDSELWKNIYHNNFVIRSYVNLLFLMISTLQTTIQEKINVLQTEINNLYDRIQEFINKDYAEYSTSFGKFSTAKKPLSIYVQFNKLYVIFYSCAVSRFGNDAMTIFSAIPNPNNEINWDTYKEDEFEKLYKTPISSYISTIEEGKDNKGANVFNNSLINTQNGWFYGKVSDRSSQDNELGYGANIASQQLEMILDDFVKETSGTPAPPFGNLSTINYFMETSGVSWNNLLIAHNWRKKEGMESKLIFKKI